jgi:hypothetical protein
MDGIILTRQKENRLSGQKDSNELLDVKKPSFRPKVFQREGTG